MDMLEFKLTINHLEALFQGCINSKTEVGNDG